MAKKIVFVSLYTQRKFTSNYGQHKSNYLLQHGIMPIDNSWQDLVVHKPPMIEKKIVFWGRVEKYKGIDIFEKQALSVPIEVYGKWSINLTPLKCSLNKNKFIHIVDRYLSIDELSTLIARNVIFILPYKNATQSGVLYTFLAHGKVFISSNVGENNDFLIKHGLNELIFDRGNRSSILDAIDYATINFKEIQSKMIEIRNEYKWDIILKNKVVCELYDD